MPRSNPISRKIMNKFRPNWLQSWQVAPGDGNSYGFLDGIRGIAILLVVACHTFYVNPQAGGLLKTLGTIISAGTLGVTVFFTLSGFLIALPFWRKKCLGESPSIRRYLLRRFWKIYPPLALSVLLLTPVYILIKGDAAAYVTVAAQWLTGVAWVVPVSSILNPVMWSLVVEVHFYVLLPLCFLATKRLGYQATLWVLGGFFLLAPPMLANLYGRFGIGWSLHPEIRVCFPIKLDAFVFGVVMAGLHAAGSLKKSWARFGHLGMVLLPVVLCHGVLADMFPRHAGWISPVLSHYGAMLATGCMLCFIAHPAAANMWGLNASWLRFLGLVSYEWYLLHQPIFLWIWRTVGMAYGSLAKYAFIILAPSLLSLLMAALIYRFFSLPILRAKRD